MRHGILFISGALLVFVTGLPVWPLWVEWSHVPLMVVPLLYIRWLHKLTIRAGQVIHVLETRLRLMKRGHRV